MKNPLPPASVPSHGSVAAAVAPAASASVGVEHRAPGAWFAHVPSIAYVRRIEQSDPPRAANREYIGSQVEAILGYASEAFLDDPHLWASRIHPDDLGRVLATWRRTSEVGDRYHLAYRMLAHDGRVV